MKIIVIFILYRVKIAVRMIYRQRHLTLGKHWTPFLGRVLTVMSVVRGWIGQHLEVPLSLLQKWWRSVFHYFYSKRYKIIATYYEQN